MHMKEILVVDDERAIRQGLRQLLTGEGYEVKIARSGDEALALIGERIPDLIVLDVMMPGTNGFRVCELLRRSHPQLPIIFLSALMEESDQVRALTAGADDFIVKTAGKERILASVRRALERVVQTNNQQPIVIRVGHTDIDLGASELRQGDNRFPLTVTECALLQLLYENRHLYLTKESLIDALRGRGFACEDSMLYTHVYNLRQKLGKDAELLVCSWRVGYKLVC